MSLFSRWSIVLCVVACGCLCLAGQAPGAAPTAPDSIYWPADSGYYNVKEHGAKGDGVTDDTAALKDALDGKKNNNHAIYLPAGTYLVSDTLSATPKRYFFQGQGPGKTIIKLKDNSPGFGDAKTPKAVIQNWSEAIGKGSNGQGFRNSYHDLTVEVGAGNPGAIGILYFTNNQGTIENVTIRSSDPQKAGRAGLAMAQNWPGPALFRHVVIDGFDDGIWSIIGQYSFTLEFVTLTNQRHAGISNRGQKLFIRGLTSKQAAAPALDCGGDIVLIDSSLSGSGQAGIVNSGQLYVRNTRVEGYKTGIQGGAGGGKSKGASAPASRETPAGLIEEYVSGAITTLFDTPKKSLNLPIEESPTGNWNNEADWVSVAKFGAAPGGDCTEAVQKAIDSGAKVVYFPHGGYQIDGTIILRGNVERIHCMESGLKVGKGTPGEKPVFRLEDGKSPFVVIEQFEGSYGDTRLYFEQASSRAWALKTMIPRGEFYKCLAAGAKLFLDDVCAAPCRLGSTKVYARQLNPENMGEHVITDGGLFWCLGLKTEKSGKIVLATGGAKAEIIGGYIYRNRGKGVAPDTKGPGGKPDPDAGKSPNAFINVNSSMSVVGISGDSSVDQTRGGDTKSGSAAGGMYVGRAD